MNFDDIGSILSSLSEEEMGNLSDMAQQFMGGDGSSNGNSNNEAAADPFGGIDPQMIAKLIELMPLLRSKGDDERTRLIAALKPLLSPQRRRKADEAIQLMRLIDMLPIIEKFM